MITDLSNKLNFTNLTKFRQSLYNIKIDGSHVFGFFMLEDDKRTMRIVVNPNVVFAGDAEQLKAIKALFSK